MTITYWSDYACPYCYIGKARLKRALKELGIEEKDVTFVRKAFELDPSAPEAPQGSTAELFGRKYRMPEEQVEMVFESMARMAAKEGITMNYGSARHVNTMNAHRLMKYAEGQNAPDLAARLEEALFRAYFTESRILSDKETLLEIAENAGLDREAVRMFLLSSKYKDEVWRDEDQAGRLGIHMVPTFFIEGARGKIQVQGAQPIDIFKDALMGQ